MKTLKTISICFLILSLYSCSNDSDNNAANDMTLNKRITYSPQEVNFDQKYVEYFENNKVIVDSTFNSQNILTRYSTYTYATGSRTKLNYNAANALTSKNIRNYDGQNRLTSVDTYDPSNILTYSQSYVYNGENIYASIFSNGVTTLKYHYKTNADGYIYYEMDVSNENFVRTMDYSGNKPILMNYIEGNTANYNYHPQMKPDNLQNNAIQTNNVALTSLFMEHIHFSCNYYLKQIIFNIGGTPFNLEREYQFNSNNYETYLKVSGVEDNGTVNNYSEAFSFYN